ncbi:Metallo-dependent phosphatase [Acephala macrosclerotiorum]|nr:Metallo-dependent phosphatase [Acephala macrosclerotiorum]
MASTSATKVATKLYKSRKTSPDKTPENHVTVVCVSDTHNQELELPDGDLLVHAGDLSKTGTLPELQAQLDWLNSQNHMHKVLIGGNHDRLLDPSFPELHPGVLPQDSNASNLNWGSLIYLSNSSATLEFPNGQKLNVYGSPYVPACGRWAFMYPNDTDVWHESIPADTDIVVTHGPPKWHLDCTLSGEHIGCPHLLRELKRVRPPLVICGHVHEAHGEENLIFDEVDSIWERMMETNGSSGGLLGMAFRIAWWNMSKARVTNDRRHTHLVNAAVVEGGMVSKGRIAYSPVVCLI